MIELLRTLALLAGAFGFLFVVWMGVSFLTLGLQFLTGE